MKKTLITIPLVMLLLGGLGQAWALTLEFSNVGNATIYFPGNSTFNFTDSTASGSSGFDFQITGSDGNDPDTWGLYGNLSGPFTIGTITQYFSGVETAPITGTGSFSVFQSSDRFSKGLSEFFRIMIRSRSLPTPQFPRA